MIGWSASGGYLSLPSSIVKIGRIREGMKGGMMAMIIIEKRT